MPNPKYIPDDVPDEVKRVLVHLRPAPEALGQERERLLVELGAQMDSSTEALQQLQRTMVEVLLSTRPEAPFNARLAEQLATALANYLKHPAAVLPPPGIISDCLLHVYSYLEAIGMGPMLAVVDELPEPPDRDDGEARRTQELQARLKLGSIRG